ncbi:MAG: xylose isomerase [Chloroflexi bacterium]|nr:xylose isomerase [Chloroflexota bacterium]
MYEPKPEDRFTFGMWTVGSVGSDPFGAPTRDPLTARQICEMLGEVGAYGVNFHDDDLIPIASTAAERRKIVADFKVAMADNGIVCPMATTNLFSDPAFKDGAFTSNDPKVRALARQKVLRTIDDGVDLGAKVFVFWGGREGTETDSSKSALDSLKRTREAINYFCEYVIDQGYDLKLALEPKPNEPRSDIYFPTAGSMLGFIATLDHPDMVGINPEVAHEHMAGLNFMHAIAQAWDAGKLFPVDLNDQLFGRYDQDFRFGAAMIKQAFYVVKFLEDVGYSGNKHFDAHAYRTSDHKDVKEFARGCMRTYLILKEKARQFNQDAEIQALLAEINADDGSQDAWLGKYDRATAAKLKDAELNRVAIGARGLPYERLDQLTIEVLLGVR